MYRRGRVAAKRSAAPTGDSTGGRGARARDCWEVRNSAGGRVCRETIRKNVLASECSLSNIVRYEQFTIDSASGGWLQKPLTRIRATLDSEILMYLDYGFRCLPHRVGSDPSSSLVEEPSLGLR